MTKENDMKPNSVFWKRLGALFIDTTILGILGLGLGLVFERQLVQLAGWGRLLGFVISLAYFGVMNSNLSDGQTIGKKLFKLKVVSADYTSIGILKSFVRYCVLGVPFFLNGAQFTSGMLSSKWVYLLSFLVFGGLFSVIYLYLFNRVTRQSLHDLIVGTFVVNVDAEKKVQGPVWKPHLMVVGALFVCAAIAPAITAKLVQSDAFEGLLPVLSALSKYPSVSYANVSYGQSSVTSGSDGTRVSTYVSAQIFLKTNSVADPNLARQFAEVLMRIYPESRLKDIIQIDLTYGYDIGIASKWNNFTHSFNPKDLLGMSKGSQKR